MEKTEIEIIYRKYFRDVFLYIRALSENESLAEEITQETFLKAMNNIEKFDGRKDIRAWLFVIRRTHTSVTADETKSMWAKNFRRQYRIPCRMHPLRY